MKKPGILPLEWRFAGLPRISYLRILQMQADEKFIANIPYKLDEEELKTMLTQFGQVASVKLLIDKKTEKERSSGSSRYRSSSRRKQR